MNLHVFAVYFPVGLLTASVAFDLIAQATDRDELRTAAWWSLVAGIFFAAAALATGVLEKPVVESAGPAARTVVDVHGTLAWVAVLLFGILALWRLVGRSRISERGRPAYLAAAVIAVTILWAATYFGIRSVWVYGLGIPRSTLESAIGRPGEPPFAPEDTLETRNRTTEEPPETDQPVDTVELD